MPPRIRGLAAKQLAFGHALRWERDASARALEEAVRLLSHHAEGVNEPGQGSLVDDDLHAIYRTTCEVYLGQGAHAIELLEPKLNGLSSGSARTATITRAKLARAYANVGQPREAAACVTTALDAHASIQSQSAYRELRRAVPALSHWRQRSDVHTVLQRLREHGPTSA